MTTVAKQSSLFFSVSLLYRFVFPDTLFIDFDVQYQLTYVIRNNIVDAEIDDRWPMNLNCFVMVNRGDFGNCLQRKPASNPSNVAFNVD